MDTKRISVSSNRRKCDEHEHFESCSQDVFVYESIAPNEQQKIDILHVHVDGSVTKISEHAFSNCMQLKTVTFPTGTGASATTKSTTRPTNSTNMTEEIGLSGFQNCKSLTTLINFQSSSIDSIGRYAFHCCTSLTSITFPKSMKYIEKLSFHNCKNLIFIDMSSTSIREIETYTFDCCVNLETIQLSKKLQQIGDSAFSHCRSLSTIELPASIRKLGVHCFYRCKELRSIRFQSPSALEIIGCYAFHCCDSLESIEMCPSPYDHQFGQKDDEIGSYVNLLPSSLVEVGAGAFKECPKLSSAPATSTPLPSRPPTSRTARTIIQDIFCDANAAHYVCDLNRGGLRFLQRHDKNQNRRAYPRSLWSLILNRINNEMELPVHYVHSIRDDLSVYTNVKSTRQASIIYYLMVNGIATDL